MISTDAWFGDLSRPISIYCERASAAWDAEPLNAVSNIAFLIAAWAAWRLQRKRPNEELNGSVAALCIIMAVVGIGSATFHTVATRWAEWADVVPILIFMIVYSWLALTVFFRWPFWLKLATVLLFFAATFYLESDDFEKILWGGAMYIPTLFFLTAAGVGIWKRDPKAGKVFFTAAGLFVLSFAARTADMPLCSQIPIGTHYFWHIFNATVLYLLVRTVILHAPGAQRLRLRGEEEQALHLGGAPMSRH